MKGKLFFVVEKGSVPPGFLFQTLISTFSQNHRSPWTPEITPNKVIIIGMDSEEKMSEDIQYIAQKMSAKRPLSSVMKVKSLQNKLKAENYQHIFNVLISVLTDPSDLLVVDSLDFIYHLNMEYWEKFQAKLLERGVNILCNGTNCEELYDHTSCVYSIAPQENSRSKNTFDLKIIKNNDFLYSKKISLYYAFPLFNIETKRVWDDKYNPKTFNKDRKPANFNR